LKESTTGKVGGNTTLYRTRDKATRTPLKTGDELSY